MITNICPACGYPTLEAALCAFCCPSDAMTGTQGFEPYRRSLWYRAKDSGSYPAARIATYPDPLAS
ncbi:hypothetical protein ACX9NE_19305 [Mycobacterium sp. ML4]